MNNCKDGNFCAAIITIEMLREYVIVKLQDYISISKVKKEIEGCKYFSVCAPIDSQYIFEAHAE